MFKDVVELWAECICLMLCVNMLNVFSPDIRPTKRSALGLGVNGAMARYVGVE